MNYKNSDVTLMIVLPNKKGGLSALETKMNQIDFIELSKSLHKIQLSNVTIPKFKIEFEINLNESLKKVSCYQKPRYIFLKLLSKYIFSWE